MEKNITIAGKQNFMGNKIPVVLGGFGEEKKCICDKTIAEIHNQPIPEIRRRINDNISRFRENIDFINLKVIVQNDNKIVMGESHNNFLTDLGYTQMQISKSEHIYLLSERGYAKLIKIMDTDLAWEIHDRLIEEYFQLRELQANISDLSLELQFMIKTELRQNQQDKKILSLQDDMKHLEAKVTTHNDDYYTIAGYARLRNLNVDIKMAKMFGKKAVKLSKIHGYNISKVKDARYGTVNTYHIDILKEVFDKQAIVLNTADMDN